MKFDFVIGNPPYQEEVAKVETKNGQKTCKSIFQHFQTNADNIAINGSVLIFPGGRWIHRFGKGMAQFGLDLINDPTLVRLDYYPKSSDVFGKDADLTDGISIVVKNRKKKQTFFDYRYIKDTIEESIVIEHPGEKLIAINPHDSAVCNKIDEFVRDKGKGKFLSETILPRSLFGIESDFVEKNPTKVRLYNQNEELKENEIKLLTNDKAGSAGRTKWYVINKDYITQGKEYINKWKVIVISANPGGQRRDSQIEIVDNRSAFGRSKVALSSFATQSEAQNFMAYCKTYIIRYAFLMSNEALTSLGKRVPDVGDYTNDNSLLDFSGDLNKQLFDLIGLTEAERQYVMDMIDDIDRKRGK